MQQNRRAKNGTNYAITESVEFKAESEDKEWQSVNL